jgi:hypothetical protein
MANMGHPSREEGFVLAPTSALPTYYDLRKQQSSRAPEFPTVGLPMITFGGDFRSLKKCAKRAKSAKKPPIGLPQVLRERNPSIPRYRLARHNGDRVCAGNALVQNSVAGKSNLSEGLSLTFLAYWCRRSSGILVSARNPFGPQFGVGEELYVHSADDRSSLETYLASRDSVIPICHWNAVGGLIKKLEYRMHDGLKIGGI